MSGRTPGRKVTHMTSSLGQRPAYWQPHSAKPGDGLEYEEDAVGARPVERPTFHRYAARADRRHRPDAHGGHQLAGRVHLPDRAIPGSATAVHFRRQNHALLPAKWLFRTPTSAASAANRTA